MDFLTLFIYSFLPSISKKSSLEIKKILALKKLNKGEILSSDGKFFILKSGIVKSFSLNNKNIAYTKNLFISGNKQSSISNIINLPISKNSFECLTDVELYECDIKQFEELMKSNIEISILSSKFLEYKVVLNENRIDSLIKLDTEKRYLILLNEFPYLEKLIPKHQIAAYLNISPVQLTRIRKKQK